jgi:hypothetical protein
MAPPYGAPTRPPGPEVDKLTGLTWLNLEGKSRVRKNSIKSAKVRSSHYTPSLTDSVQLKSPFGSDPNCSSPAKLTRFEEMGMWSVHKLDGMLTLSVYGEHSGKHPATDLAEGDLRGQMNDPKG